MTKGDRKELREVVQLRETIAVMRRRLELGLARAELAAGKSSPTALAEERGELVAAIKLALEASA